jgi:DNA-binding beta-propeller fold protein YncE
MSGKWMVDFCEYFKMKKFFWAGCMVSMFWVGGALSQESLVRVGRIQALGKTNAPQDIYDVRIQSPKSAMFSQDGKKLYINALEGGQTLVYSFPELQPLKSIDHTFGPADAAIFQNETTVFGYPYFYGKAGQYNHFLGKPVEMAMSHNGKYLWVPYYRRSFDLNASSPSALAIIDMQTDKVVRVMPTGPLPKYVAIAPDSKQAVVTHWGDNTLGVLDISAEHPRDFRYSGHWVVERKLPTEGIKGNRDNNCGFCLRGTVYSPDGQTVLVARMGGGGVAGFEAATGRYLGTVTDIVPNPRHMVVSHDGRALYVSGNKSGLVGAYDLAAVVQALKAAGGQRVAGPGGRGLSVGMGVRTIELSPDQRSLYAAINNDSKLVKIDLSSWSVVARSDVDPFTVGLAVSPDGKTIVTTSQGREMVGGHSVGLYRDATR